MGDYKKLLAKQAFAMFVTEAKRLSDEDKCHLILCVYSQLIRDPMLQCVLIEMLKNYVQEDELKEAMTKLYDVLTSVKLNTETN